MVGIIQEQHPDRARLFMQWKEMGWPIDRPGVDWLTHLLRTGCDHRAFGLIKTKAFVFPGQTAMFE